MDVDVASGRCVNHIATGGGGGGGGGGGSGSGCSVDRGTCVGKRRLQRSLGAICVSQCGSSDVCHRTASAKGRRSGHGGRSRFDVGHGGSPAKCGRGQMIEVWQRQKVESERPLSSLEWKGDHLTY